MLKININAPKTRLVIFTIILAGYVVIGIINFVVSANIKFHEHKHELEKLMEQNRRLFNDLKRQHHEIIEMEEHIRGLEEILEYRKAIYSQVVLQGEGASFDLTRPSGFSPEMFEYVFRKFNREGMQGSGSDFVRLERELAINAVAIAAISIHESGWGTSYLSRTKNNYFGWSAYESDPFRWAASFTSRAHSIAYVGEKIKENYLTPGGPYYRGPTFRGMNVSYASDPNWSGKVSAVMSIIVSSAIDKEKAEKLFNYEPYDRRVYASDYYFLGL